MIPIFEVKKRRYRRFRGKSLAPTGSKCPGLEGTRHPDPGSEPSSPYPVAATAILMMTVSLTPLLGCSGVDPRVPDTGWDQALASCVGPFTEA